MNTTARSKTRSPIGVEEMDRRREIVRRAVAGSRIEGIVRDPTTDPIFEAYIRGEIDAREIVGRLNQLRGLGSV